MNRTWIGARASVGIGVARGQIPAADEGADLRDGRRTGDVSGDDSGVDAWNSLRLSLAQLAFACERR